MNTGGKRTWSFYLVRRATFEVNGREYEFQPVEVSPVMVRDTAINIGKLNLPITVTEGSIAIDLLNAKGSNEVGVTFWIGNVDGGIPYENLMSGSVSVTNITITVPLDQDPGTYVPFMSISTTDHGDWYLEAHNEVPEAETLIKALGKK